MQLGENLKQLRINAKMSQADLAKELDVAQSSIAYWEHGERVPSVEACIKLSKLFNISLDMLTGTNLPTVGEKIKALRESKNWTQEHLAQLTNMSVSDIQMYENDDYSTTSYGCSDIANAFGMGYYELLNDTSTGMQIARIHDKRIESYSSRLISYFDKLNDIGKETAVHRVEELTKISDYTD